MVRPAPRVARLLPVALAAAVVDVCVAATDAAWEAARARPRRIIFNDDGGATRVPTLTPDAPEKIAVRWDDAPVNVAPRDARFLAAVLDRPRVTPGRPTVAVTATASSVRLDDLILRLELPPPTQP